MNKVVYFRKGNWSIYREAGKLYIEANHIGYSLLHIHKNRMRKGLYPYFTMESHVSGYPVSVDEFLYSKRKALSFFD